MKIGRLCAQCGAPFTPCRPSPKQKREGYEQKTCSRKCSSAFFNPLGPYREQMRLEVERRQAVMAAEAQLARAAAKAEKLEQEAAYAAARQQTQTGSCAECGVRFEFATIYTGKRRKYCSFQCGKRSHRRMRKHL